MYFNFIYCKYEKYLNDVGIFFNYMNNKNVFMKTMLPLYLCVSQSGHIGSTNFECHEQSFLINIATLSLFSRSRYNAMTQ